MSSEGDNHSAFTFNGFLEINGPNGFEERSGTYTIPGQTSSTWWYIWFDPAIGANVSVGTYCVGFWTQNHGQLLGSECHYVS